MPALEERKGDQSQHQPVAVMYKPGGYKLTWSNGQQALLEASEKLQGKAITGPREVIFDTLWGARPELTIDQLQSWTGFRVHTTCPAERVSAS